MTKKCLYCDNKPYYSFDKYCKEHEKKVKFIEKVIENYLDEQHNI